VSRLLGLRQGLLTIAGPGVIGRCPGQSRGSHLALANSRRDDIVSEPTARIAQSFSGCRRPGVRGHARTIKGVNAFADPVGVGGDVSRRRCWMLLNDGRRLHFFYPVYLGAELRCQRPHTGEYGARSRSLCYSAPMS
jgi:hypothetical protein